MYLNRSRLETSEGVEESVQNQLEHRIIGTLFVVSRVALSSYESWVCNCPESVEEQCKPTIVVNLMISQ